MIAIIEYIILILVLTLFIVGWSYGFYLGAKKNYKELIKNLKNDKEKNR